MFGLKLITQKQLAEINRSAYNEALANIIALLRNKDNIYLEPVTMEGSGQTITNCAFLGPRTGLSLKPKEVPDHLHGVLKAYVND